MTALADALRAAQAQTIAAAQRAYLAGMFDGTPEHTTEQRFRDLLDEIGCTDKIEQEHLLAALEALRGFGVQGQAPTPPGGSQAATDPATKAQTGFAQKLADERGTTLPGYPLTKEQASKIIEELKSGTYSAESWEVPF